MSADLVGRLREQLKQMPPYQKQRGKGLLLAESLSEIERLQSELSAYADSDRIKSENLERLRGALSTVREWDIACGRLAMPKRLRTLIDAALTPNTKE